MISCIGFRAGSAEPLEKNGPGNDEEECDGGEDSVRRYYTVVLGQGRESIAHAFLFADKDVSI